MLYCNTILYYTLYTLYYTTDTTYTTILLYYCTILYYTILYYTILYYTRLYQSPALRAGGEHHETRTGSSGHECKKLTRNHWPLNG